MHTLWAYDQKCENLEVAPETYFKSIFKFGRGKMNFVG